MLREQEDWFEAELELVRRLLRPGDRVVDVGASHGVYALSAAVAVGASGRVLALEPAAAPFAHLARGAALLGSRTSLRCVQVGLSARAGRALLTALADDELGAIVAEGGATEGSVEEIDVTTLDAALAEHELADVDLVKIDAEGHEGAILDGATALLRDRSPLLLLEIKSGERADLTPLERLRRHGYAALRLVPGPCLLAPLDEDGPLDGFALNAFACKADRAAQLAARGLLALPGSAAAARLDALRATLRAAEAEGDALALADAAAQLGQRERAVATLLGLVDGGFQDEATAARVLRPLEMLRSFSSCFTGEAGLPLLEAYHRLGVPDAGMERRRQLVRMVAGLQTAPEPSPTLLADTLDPAYWSS